MLGKHLTSVPIENEFWTGYRRCFINVIREAEGDRYIRRSDEIYLAIPINQVNLKNIIFMYKEKKFN